MILPKSFELAGLTVTIEINNNAIKENNFIGQSDFVFQKIIMDIATAPRETVEQAFFHEAVHWILYIMNEHTLRNNEQFVDVFAHLLYQLLSSGDMLNSPSKLLYR